jgi:Pvc16 N-terminal domain
MSDFTVIRAVTETLRSILEAGITNSPDMQLNGVPIDLRSPKEMREHNNATGISLWLYRVVRDPDLLNRPPERISPTQVRRASLPVCLYYLVTPLVALPEDRQTLLGRVLQIFNDHSQLRGADLKDSLVGSTEEFRVNLEALSLEELTRVWYSLSEPYDLSVSYEVHVATIDTDTEAVQGPPVLVRTSSYEQIVGSS